MKSLFTGLFFTITICLFLLSCRSEFFQKDDVTIASYYFPNYHPDDRNANLHGQGWTEWELVKAARPRFSDHHQPNLPLWGYTDESDPVQMAQKIDAAADYGIDVFIFDWYYYDDGPFLQNGLEKGFMPASNVDRLNFALMWANHDWIDIHPRQLDIKPKVVFPGVITQTTFDSMTDMIIDRYFKHPSYWKINGAPYFSVYELQTLVKGFDGDLTKTRQALERFRQKTKQAGFTDLHLNAVIWGNPILPGEERVKNAAELVDFLGFDSVTSYVWIHHVALPDFPQTPYNDVRDKYLDYAKSASEQFNVPYFPNLTMGWDASPRCAQQDPFINKGYPFMATLSGNTPSAFGTAASEVLQLVRGRRADEKIITVNCWNEWTEGSYLEPDSLHGYDYLKALKKALRNQK